MPVSAVFRPLLFRPQLGLTSCVRLKTAFLPRADRAEHRIPPVTAALRSEGERRKS